MPGEAEVQYLVLPDATNPYFLARVRWPDIYQAISSARPEWQDDPGLFDLPYNPSSTRVTPEQAAAIAADWGAHLPSEDTPHVAEFSLIRRMPADWSNLSPAEKRAWNLEFVRTRRSITAGIDGATSRSSRRHSRSWLGRWRRDRAVISPLPADIEPEQEELVLDLRDLAAEPGAGVESATWVSESVSTEELILDLRDSAAEPVAGVESATWVSESVSTEELILDLRDSAAEPVVSVESATWLIGPAPIAVTAEAPNGRGEDEIVPPVSTAQVLDLPGMTGGGARDDGIDKYPRRPRSWLGRWRRDGSVVKPWRPRSEPAPTELILDRPAAPVEALSGPSDANLPIGPPVVSLQAANGGGEHGAGPLASTAHVIDLREMAEVTEPDDRIDESATS